MKKKGNALLKNILREIRGTAGRFIAIFAITALGAGFYAGLKATGPDMIRTANHYYNTQRLMDYRLLSPYGFTEGDVAALRERDDVEAVMATQGLDLLVDIPDGTEAARLHALPQNRNADNPDYLNQLVLMEGRLPEGPGECVADSARGYAIGDVIRISAENSEDSLDLMAGRTFTVVGLARSPYYISFQRGNTTIGNGRISFFMYVDEAAFSSEYYTEIYLRATGAAALGYESEAYETLADNGVDSLEAFGLERAQVRYDEIYAEASGELADAQKELDDARAEADEKLGEAWQKILDGEAEIADGWREVARNERKLTDAARDLEDGWDALAAARRTLEAADIDYAAALNTYNTGREGLDALLAGVDGVDAAAAPLPGLAGLIASTTGAEQAGYIVAFGGYAEGAAAGLEQLAAALRAAGMENEAAGLEAAAAGARMQLAGGQYEDVISTLGAATGGMRAALAPRQAQLEEAAAQLASARQTLNDGWGQLAQSQQALADGEAELADGRRQLADARATLAEAEQELADGKAEYETEKADAEQKIAEAEEELAEGRQTLADLEQPEWFVFSRSGNPGYSGFWSDADRIDAIAIVIPPFFFLVAALVCLTTMTRMVEEQRTQIGTLKALGYSKGAIAFKYIFYAGVATLLGACLGVAGGFVAFPATIWNAYQIMYIMPALQLGGNWGLAVASVAVSVLVTTLATLAACIGELRSVPAGLMRPKPPRAGQRVFLERIPFIWKHIGFNGKITVRNLFRYKRRFFMTVIGVAGCAALLLTGFGLRDSITGIVSVQYDSIYHQDITAALAEASDSTANTPLNEALPGLGTALYYSETVIDLETDRGNNAGTSTTLYVAEDSSLLPEFVTMRDRKTGAGIPFPQGSGAVITEKVADRLQAGVGDVVRISRVNEKPVEVTIAGVMENYLLNYVFITPETYESLFGQAPAYDMLLLKLPENAALTPAETLEKLVNTEGVAGATDVAYLRSTFDDMFGSLNAVVWLIIAAAGMLAFVVLYNLTNINITERAREIATLKVLGFYQGEVASYVYRENILLTLIGSVVGLAGGVFLHQFVIQTAEIDEVMFRRVVQPQSYVFSVVFTLLSALLVGLVMLKKLKNVDMVESLKSVE